MGGVSELWHRKQAMLIVGQLPDDKADALKILGAAKWLVEHFLAKAAPSTPAAAVTAAAATEAVIETSRNVVPFIAG
jgi:hypothetical protein